MSVVPKTFGVREELIDPAWEATPDETDWPILASKSGVQSADPELHYRGRSFTGGFTLPFPTEHGVPSVASKGPMRRLVVLSDALAERFDPSLETSWSGRTRRWRRRIGAIWPRSAPARPTPKLRWARG